MALLTQWPSNRLPLDRAKREHALKAVNEAFASAIANLQVDLGLEELFEKIYVPIACWVYEQHQPGTPLVVGINGAQGSGKARLFNLLEVVLSEAFGLRVANLSIDDIYLTRAEREKLADTVHPMLATRGVPGTHDVELGLRLLQQLKQTQPGDVVRIPMFDKSTDERMPEESWQEFVGPVDVIVFDGWCIGAAPEPEARLSQPINDLEIEEDSDGSWRRYVNEQLAGPYQTLFDEVDLLICLQVPNMQAVYNWRAAQEVKLSERAALLYEDRTPTDPLRIMGSEEIRRFIAHYERLTRWMIEDIPRRADLTLELNDNHKIAAINIRG
jgi:D-glycerate 3-kinase